MDEAEMRMILRRRLWPALWTSALALNLTCGVAGAQDAGPTTGVKELKQIRGGPATTSPVSFDDARTVYLQLRKLFAQYPPSVLRVLQLDPSLINNTTYLAPYPSLANYFSQHPEIAHNPTFFLGNPDQYEYRDRTFGQAIGRAVEPLAVASVFIVLIAIIGWIIRGIINHRRWLRVSKLQTDMQNKLLERFSSNEEMLAFIQTPAGRKFLEFASVTPDVGPRAISAPIGRILWSVQLGIITLVAGSGLEFVGYRLNDTDAETVFKAVGALVIALGIGFILSALGSYILSRRLGLMEPPSPSPS
jgi:hypothetical protein